MIKKGTSKQNIAIIVLIVLLLLSITFGATYSYFNGSTNQVTGGSITTAILRIDLAGEYDPQQIEIGSGRDGVTILQGKVVPGQPLANTALSIYNYSEVSTYMMVIFTFTAQKATTGEVVDTTGLDVLDIQEGSTCDGWVKHTHTCNDGSKIYGVVYMGNDSETGEIGKGYGVIPKWQDAITDPSANYSILNVLTSDCLQAPKSWGTALMGCTLTFSFTAYAIQTESISDKYTGVVNENSDVRRSAIAKAILELNGLDTSSSAE